MERRAGRNTHDPSQPRHALWLHGDTRAIHVDGHAAREQEGSRPAQSTTRAAHRLSRETTHPPERTASMNSILGDIRYALRRARTRAGFTAIAVLSLGLGIGINTAVFSLVNAIVLRKTPLAHPEKVADVYWARDKRITGPLSYPDYRDLKEQGKGVFSQFS